MTTFEHRIFMSDGRSLTATEFEQELASGKLSPVGYGELYWARDTVSKFVEIPKNNQEAENAQKNCALIDRRS